MNNADRYSNGEYLKYNPTWSVENSSWKAGKIELMLKKNSYSPNSVCEIGCGAGEILNCLHSKFPLTNFIGYEISEQAYELCKTRQKERLNYKFGDLLADSNTDYYELLLIIDVVEHIEDYFTFLRKCKDKAKMKLFHIPLDMNIQGVLRTTPILTSRKMVGHLHYFSKETALAALSDCGYSIIDCFFTFGSIELKNRSFKNLFLDIPRKILQPLSKDLTARLFGGSLLVLAE
jgi:cyclopropane fatty-acyl-phospholipid synthase-like methyltransferase